MNEYGFSRMRQALTSSLSTDALVRSGSAGMISVIAGDVGTGLVVRPEYVEYERTVSERARSISSSAVSVWT